MRFCMSVSLSDSTRNRRASIVSKRIIPNTPDATVCSGIWVDKQSHTRNMQHGYLGAWVDPILHNTQHKGAHKKKKL